MKEKKNKKKSTLLLFDQPTKKIDRMSSFFYDYHTLICVCFFPIHPLGSSEVPHNPLTRWDVSSIPANGIFLTKKLKKTKKMPNGWRTIKSLVHKI